MSEHALMVRALEPLADMLVVAGVKPDELEARTLGGASRWMTHDVGVRRQRRLARHGSSMKGLE